MRDEFEAHAKVRWSTDYDDFGDGLFSIQADGRYEYEHIQWDWETWQASRAALRVELPPEFNAGDLFEDTPIYNASMIKVILQQAGIEVKQNG
ncbi:hypothetical protein IPC1133_19720 [Pseudomonas aeruginosa]|nr:hypothetical protein FC629_22885 [Pseudomonas aeruginosa]RPP78587.1 hypothetical protein IPC1133_19720 [Pseudomonas aeruginosa]RPP95576.1 hypothetical protein IPC1125_22085 [Pseudomonas aeruginosa]HBO7192917.1 hypothetical protein [Pseudomonas aeruginosa]